MDDIKDLLAYIMLPTTMLDDQIKAIKDYGVRERIDELETLLGGYIKGGISINDEQLDIVLVSHIDHRLTQLNNKLEKE